MGTNEPNERHRTTLNEGAQNTEIGEEQQLPTLSEGSADDKLFPSAGLVGAVLMGLVAVIKQLERCPNAAKVVERLAYGAMLCMFMVTAIKYWHR